jgi:predicted enzyme related to lactoylglutathione lyase
MRGWVAAGPLHDAAPSPAWTLYFGTEDAAATVKAVERAGGAVTYASLGDAYPGPRAGFTDPAGASFSVWQLGDGVGLDAVTVPGSLCWTELQTTDPAAATAFYRRRTSRWPAVWPRSAIPLVRNFPC